jgi:hypothetical protein
VPERNKSFNVLRAAIAIALTGLSGLPIAAHAEEPIDTDGPDFVESSEVVPIGRVQYELDAAFTKSGRTGLQAPRLATPLLMKYGIAQDFELRMETDGYQRRAGQTGYADIAFGFKWHSHDRDAARGLPAVSWIFHVDTPSGSAEFRGQKLRPSVRSVLTWDLPHDLALGLMPGIAYRTREDGQRFVGGILGVVLNRRFSDQTRAFVEISAPSIARASDGGNVLSWDIGAAHLLSQDTQLGVRAGVAGNSNSPKRYLLLELAQRF